jgi:hypothetical protein
MRRLLALAVVPLNLLRRVAGLPNAIGIKLTQWLNPTHVLQCCSDDEFIVGTAAWKKGVRPSDMPVKPCYR